MTPVQTYNEKEHVGQKEIQAIQGREEKTNLMLQSRLVLEDVRKPTPSRGGVQFSTATKRQREGLAFRARPRPPHSHH